MLNLETKSFINSRDIFLLEKIQKDRIINKSSINKAVDYDSGDFSIARKVNSILSGEESPDKNEDKKDVNKRVYRQ